MLVSLLTTAAIAAVPKVAAGPDLKANAVPTAAPIDQVEVFSDRARITRRGSFKTAGPVAALRLPDLPGATWMDTIRASTSRGTVLRVEAIPVQRERVSIDEVEELLVQLEGQTDEIARLDAEVAALRQQLTAVSGLRPAAPAPEADRRGPVKYDPNGWRQVLDFFGGLRTELRKKILALEIQRRGKARALAATQQKIQGMNLGAFSDQKVQVILLVEARGAGNVELSYDVPGAFWKPAYDLHYDAKRGTVELETYGVVQQATGEPWTDAALVLSTGIPGRDIALPELLTWTLGEAKEFIPKPRARRTPPRAPRYPAPQPGADREQIERQARLSLLQRRLSELTQLSQLDVAQKGWFDANKDARSGGRSEARRRYKSKKRRSRPRPSRGRPSMQSAPAPAPKMDFEDDMVMGDIAAESVAPTSARVRSSRGSSGEAVRRTSLALFEPQIRRGPQLSDADLPAVSAAGFEYVFRARTRMTVPSTNERLRAPLGRQRYPVSAFYEAAPALAKNAFLKATVKNSGKQPILQGPVTIFVNGGFAGDGRLRTTAPGGTLALPFGADEDIELLYQVVPKTETQGVFGKDEVTTYRVVMEVVSRKKKPVSVVLREPLPRSRHEDIEVELVKTTVKPDDKDDSNVLQWTVTIPPGRKQSIELVYRIRRPEGWQLRQQ